MELNLDYILVFYTLELKKDKSKFVVSKFSNRFFKVTLGRSNWNII